MQIEDPLESMTNVHALKAAFLRHNIYYQDNVADNSYYTQLAKSTRQRFNSKHVKELFEEPNQFIE
jgi:hypothetical protein